MSEVGYNVETGELTLKCGCVLFIRVVDKTVPTFEADVRKDCVATRVLPPGMPKGQRSYLCDQPQVHRLLKVLSNLREELR